MMTTADRGSWLMHLKARLDKAVDRLRQHRMRGMMAGASTKPSSRCFDVFFPLSLPLLS